MPQDTPGTPSSAPPGQIGFYGVTRVFQPAETAQAPVTLGSVDGGITGLTISDPPTRAEVQAPGDKCEELADDVGALATLVQALRGALVAVGVVAQATSFIPSTKLSLTHKNYMR